MSATEVIKKRYDRTSLFYDLMEKGFMERLINTRTRAQVIGLAYGKVLEVGVGTGLNLEFYASDCDVTGIDFSPGMLRKAEKRARGLDNVTLCEMDAQDLKFPDNTFDTVVATCVFCSVPDPVRGLEEVRRVCKPDGVLVFLEHIKSSNKFMGLLMDMFNPVVVRVIGSNINRETLKNMETAGLYLERVDTVGMDILKLVVARPNK